VHLGRQLRSDKRAKPVWAIPDVLAHFLEERAALLGGPVHFRAAPSPCRRPWLGRRFALGDTRTTLAEPLGVVGLTSGAMSRERRQVNGHVAFPVTNQSAKPNEGNTAPGAAVFLKRAYSASGDLGNVILS